MALPAGYREIPAPRGRGWGPQRGALACLWVHVAPADGGAPTLVLPDACCDLVWQIGGRAFVAGPDTGPVLAPARPGAVTVGARFAPGAGGVALGLPLSELRDLRVDLADLAPGLAPALRGDPAPGDGLRAVCAAARGLLDGRGPDPVVAEAARRLADPRERVEQLAAGLGLSERQLRRRVRAGVGYGPKTLQRVLRFRQALAALDAAGPRPDLARIARAAGYADQPHLSRECSRLSGLSPLALARRRGAAAADDALATPAPARAGSPTAR